MDLFRKRKTEPVEYSKKSEKEEVTEWESVPVVEEGNIIDEEEATKDIDPSEILNNLKEFSRLLPRLDEKKERSEKRIHQVEEKISEVEDLILKLEEKKDNLQEEISHSKEEIEKIDEIRSVLQRIVGENAAALTAISKI